MIVGVEEKYRGGLPAVRVLADVVVFPKNQVRLWGKISTIAPVTGRRQILTADPADNSNRDVVEVLIVLENKPENIPIGLRVSVLFFE